MRIKEVIKEKGLTINELAEKLEVSRQALGKQIKGKMLVETADKIAFALGVPTWQLFVSPAEVSSSSSCDSDFIALIKSGKELYSSSSIDETMVLLDKIKQQAD